MRRYEVFLVGGALVLGLVVAVAYWQYVAYWSPQSYESEIDHFKYGSIGSDDAEGIPYVIWEILPELFWQHLPDPDAYRNNPARTPLDGYRQFGFVLEPGRTVPIGFSQCHITVNRIGLTCSVCHTSTLKVTPEMDMKKLYGDKWPYELIGPSKDRVVIVGMPAQTLDLQRYIAFLFACVSDGKFTEANIMAHLEHRHNLSAADRLIYSLAIPRVRDGLLDRRQRFVWLAGVPDFGPGRVDTFNPYKGMQFRFPVDGTIGTADIPAIWNQGSRLGMRLHWDGNNNQIFERHLTASFGAGARPISVDEEGLIRLARWCGTPDPRIKIARADLPARIAAARQAPYPRQNEMQIPGYPFPIDADAVQRGRGLFAQHCADCHAWDGSRTGKTTPLAELQTDPNRHDSFTPELSANFSQLGIGRWWRFKGYSCSDGYANVPLDGIWLRAPYLHNGSVPSLLDLFNPPCSPEDLAELGLPPTIEDQGFDELAVADLIARARERGRRPPLFYRGNDEFDPVSGGFVSTRSTVDGARPLFLYDTRQRGNSAGGHLYGVDLPEADKRAVVEYMKTLGGPARD